MAISDMRMETSYNARMFAMADRLFVEFDHLPVGRVFTAVANARATVKKCHHSRSRIPARWNNWPETSCVRHTHAGPIMITAPAHRCASCSTRRARSTRQSRSSCRRGRGDS